MLVGAAVLAVSLVGCGGVTSKSSRPAECEVSIGFFGATTGDYAGLGQNIRQAVELAVRQHEAEANPCHVRLKTFDSQADPAQAPALAKKAIDTQDLVGLVGPAFSGESKAAGPLLNEAGLPWVTTATNPALASNGWTTFHRVLGNDATQAPAAVRYLISSGARRVFVVDDASEYGSGLADIVRDQLAKAAVGHDTVQAKQTDFSSTVIKVQAAHVDSVYFGGYYAEAGLLLRQLRQAGVRARFVSDDGAKDPAMIETAGADAAEGSVVTCPCIPAERAKTFASAYRAAYHRDPGTYGAESYDGAKALLAGIDAGATDRAALNRFLGTFRANGAAGQVGWRSDGEPLDPTVWAYEVRGGAFTPLRPLG
ncbi:branched-chain amino acid ABC transporter substrate-binding protein [Angustibacter sp. McL0619]|uniref:branched-chain amino acid ABC transporter substrate-binding protein n=1 Tax=Angustibacter sp. McL0619 TaxID=3415676 RepID=UPI003CFAE3CA